MAISGINSSNNVNFYAERNRYQSTQSLSDTQMYEKMTSMVTTSPSTHTAQNTRSITQNDNTALTNAGQNSILNTSNSTNHSRNINTIGLMSARNQLADTNIAHASLVGNRNNIVNQYQNFMRQGAHDGAKRALDKIG